MSTVNEAFLGYEPAWAQERARICRNCEFYSATLCKKRNEYAKTLYTHHNEKCPINKWDIVVFE